MTAPVVLLSPDEREEVCAILGSILPPDVSAWVFGSRAGGNPKPWSDLDLVLEGDGVLPLSLLAELTEAFDESALPWKVDLVDRRAITPQFRAIIDRDRMPLVWQGAA
ncbi:nucleotidyltransferase domain-containing protein [Novosphingobium sp. SL115]|uniref:nucleotidyltransferase family protein n=1 Tax=Novosphingobium sp. SL115 TaxID=2995150 RepID=UPI00227519E6|nr:nucleotidyltransferase domain-containing protein [Novosphingobium sp. SL115]MCY1670659.1 nucleotidyltransferase domain-containing protein [Novosphingobium sp. SL115]